MDFELRRWRFRRNYPHDRVWLVGVFVLADGLACSLWLERRATGWDLAGITVHPQRDIITLGPITPDAIGEEVADGDTTAQLTEDASDGEPPPVTARMLRELPIGAMTDELRSQVRRGDDGAFVERLVGPGLARRPGRRRQPDRFYAEVAQAYTQALDLGSRSPARDIAEAENYSTSMVNNWIHEARRRGLLTDAPAGRAGGHLTDRARLLLEHENDEAPRERSTVKLTKQSLERLDHLEDEA